MNNYQISDLITSTDRYKIYILLCKPVELSGRIEYVQSLNINTVNIGKELAKYIEGLEDYRYLNIDVYDFTRKLLDKNKSKINGTGNDIVAIHNLGILMEPALELTASKLFSEFSKSTTLLIIWENEIDTSNRLNWATQAQNIFLDFSEPQLKNLRYAI